MQIKINYNDLNHSYEYNGEQIPSVTYLLNGKVEVVTDAMVRGNQVHSAIFAMLNPNSTKEEKEEAMEYIDDSNLQILKYLQNMQATHKFAAFEYPLGKEIEGVGLFAGTIDAICKDLKSNKFIGIDIKTKQGVNKQTVNKKHKLQGAAYCLIFNLEKFIIVYADTQYILEKEELEKYKKEFLEIFKVYKGLDPNKIWNNGTILKDKNEYLDIKLNNLYIKLKEKEKLEKEINLIKDDVNSKLLGSGYKHDLINIRYTKASTSQSVTINQDNIQLLYDKLQDDADKCLITKTISKKASYSYVCNKETKN